MRVSNNLDISLESKQDDKDNTNEDLVNDKTFSGD